LIRRWFAKRPRFHVHYTPTYGSWINLVERWFAELTNNQIPAGFTAVSANWRPPSANSSPPTTKPPSLSFGPKPPTKSSPASLATRNALSPPNPGNLSHEPLGQETRESGRLHLSGWSANWTCGPDGSQTGNPSRLMVHRGIRI